MLYFFKINLLTVVLEYICSAFHLAVINLSKLSVKINGTVDCVKTANLRPQNLLQYKISPGNCSIYASHRWTRGTDFVKPD